MNNIKKRDEPTIIIHDENNITQTNSNINQREVIEIGIDKEEIKRSRLEDI